jgi:hypothetical protein
MTAAGSASDPALAKFEEPARDWLKEELDKIAAADDLHIAPFLEDGKTLRTSTWIWSVAVDGGLYVRAYNGTGSRWHRVAMRERGGQIHAAGRIHNVAFTAVEGPLNDRIDDAYRTKYAISPYLAPMISARARAALVGSPDASSQGLSHLNREATTTP